MSVTITVSLDETLAKRIAETESPAVLASIAKRAWAKPYFGAVPYLEAMRALNSFDERFGCDEGRSIGLYFLSNASSWRGDVAKAVKTRVKELCK